MKNVSLRRLFMPTVQVVKTRNKSVENLWVLSFSWHPGESNNPLMEKMHIKINLLWNLKVMLVQL